MTGRSGCGRKGWMEERKCVATSRVQVPAPCLPLRARFHETNSMGPPSYAAVAATTIGSYQHPALLRTSKPKPKPPTRLAGPWGLLQSVSRAYKAWLALFTRGPGGLQVGSASAQSAIHRLAAL